MTRFLAHDFMLLRYRRRRPSFALASVLLLSMSSGLASCTDLKKLAGTQDLPSGTVDPSVYHTPAGARALYDNALLQFEGDNISLGSFVKFVLEAGVLSDELQANNFGGQALTSRNDIDQIDARQLPEGVSMANVDSYVNLQTFRSAADEAIGALGSYDDTAPPALRGRLYALQGYAELFLADLYCSGIPLSTLDFVGSYTYHAGSTRDQVYMDARAKFDTALTLAGDSVQVLNLARVGKGRAWLALGQFDSAAAAVAGVPTGFVYQIENDWSLTFLGTSAGSVSNDKDGYTVSDREGTNGLPFRSNHDPRDSVEQRDLNAFAVPLYAPLKYGGATPGIFPITVADWIEARLIVAEAALPTHNPEKWGNWLDALNALRAQAPIPGTTQPDPAALSPLQDPGTDSGRVSLLFQERAYWLFLTGHRQGDLRRLIRQYGRSADLVYPIGSYPLGGSLLNYGSYVNIPVPSTEHLNPLFTGCLSRGA